MQIAGDKRLTNVSQGKHLPPSWTTLYELTKLNDDTFDQKLRDGSINPEMLQRFADCGIGRRADGRTTERLTLGTGSLMAGFACRGDRGSALR
jgi:hypothetical protein